jgi:hypothetical protein
MAIELETDEIVSIIALSEEETIDIELDGNRLFFANNILTHNCGVDEVEFNHSHISGGLSKIQTADNVFGIFTTKAMRERGQYQLQMLKTRNSGGVGSKIDLAFDIDTLRITDFDDADATNMLNKPSMIDVLQRRPPAVKDDNEVPVKATVGSSKLRELLNNLKMDE